MLSGRTQRRAFALIPKRLNENINVIKYFIALNGDRTRNQSILQSHFVLLRGATTDLNKSLIISFIFLALSRDGFLYLVLIDSQDKKQKYGNIFYMK